MKRVFNGIIDILCEKTGYDYDFLVEKYNEAMDNGIEVADFVDVMLDSTIFGG